MAWKGYNTHPLSWMISPFKPASNVWLLEGHLLTLSHVPSTRCSQVYSQGAPFHLCSCHHKCFRRRKPPSQQMAPMFNVEKTAQTHHEGFTDRLNQPVSSLLFVEVYWGSCSTPPSDVQPCAAFSLSTSNVTRHNGWQARKMISKHLPPDALVSSAPIRGASKFRKLNGCPAKSANFNMKRGAISCHRIMKF